MLWLRSYVCLPRNTADDLDRRVAAEAPNVCSRIERWSIKDPRLVGCTEANTHESLSFDRFPESHRKHIAATTWWDA